MMELIDLFCNEIACFFVKIVDFHEEVFSLVGSITFGIVLVNIIDEFVDVIDFEDRLKAFVEQIDCSVEFVDLSLQLITIDEFYHFLFFLL